MQRSAFTLVELSIVLVILGLLVGGVLAGQSLIRAAQLRSITSQYQRYATALQSFQDKYRGLPGDISNAQNYWGVANASPAICVTTPTADGKTCNGNNDGFIYPSAGSNESFRAWQQLASAGLIEGSYDGIAHGTTNYSTTSANSPVGRPGNSIWFIWGIGNSTGTTGDMFAADYGGAYIMVGGITTNNWPSTPIFTPAEMAALDIKLDDGKPATGDLLARNYSTCTNAANPADTTATYTLTSTTIGCAAIWPHVM